MIQIIYIATGSYIKYVKGFLNSLKFFFPNERKILKILSDSFSFLHDFDLDNDNVTIDCVTLLPMIYPTINMNKAMFINSVISESANYVFYFDADTIFIEKQNYDWDALLKDMDMGNVLLARHPFYAMNQGDMLWGCSRDDLISNLYTTNLTEKDDRFSCYIEDEEYVYINSAFWGANSKVMIEFNNTIIVMMRADLVKYPYGYHVPKYIDENYVNKIYNNVAHGVKYPYGIKVNQYSKLYGTKGENIETIFMYQKNIEGNKEERG